jgi:hypothetical protein
MEPSEAGAAPSVATPEDRLKELSASARGGHTIQMAVLGVAAGNTANVGRYGVSRVGDAYRSPAANPHRLTLAALDRCCPPVCLG